MGQSRNENILENILGAQNPLGEPQSREEALLMQILEQGGGGGSSTLAGLTDVSVTSPSNEQILKYDGETGKWVNDNIKNEIELSKTSGPSSIVSFISETDMAYKSVIANVVATQSGSGAPYPPGSGKNKFDKSTVNQGALINSSGNYVSYPNNNVSDYTPVVEGVGYYLYGITLHPNTLQDNFELFDGSKTKVGYANVKTNEYPYTIPSGVKFVRFTVHDDDLNTAMFATSEGEYEPYSNIRPINGYTEANITRCGVNLWDEEWELGYFNTANGQPLPISDRIRSKNFISITPETAFRLVIASSHYIMPLFYDKDKNYLGYIANGVYTSYQNPFTSLSNACYMTFYVSPSYGTTYNNDISINYPSTDTTYHAYNGQTYTIAFGQTVYGGVLDVTRGKLTVTHFIKDSFVYGETALIGINQYGIANFGIVVSTPFDFSKGAISNCLERQYTTGTTTQTPGFFINNSNELYVRVESTTASTISDFVTWANANLQILFTLATPFDIDLTPEVISAVVGTNNVFADCGETTVGYYNSIGESIHDLVEESVEFWTDISGTLEAGETEITLTNSAITTSSTIEVFNDLDVPYVSKTVSTGSITLTFDEQDSDMSVKVRVS